MTMTSIGTHKIKFNILDSYSAAHSRSFVPSIPMEREFNDLIPVETVHNKRKFDRIRSGKEIHKTYVDSSILPKTLKYIPRTEKKIFTALKVVENRKENSEHE